MQVIAKAWADPRFKEKLLKHPEQAFKEMGVEVPKGKKFEIHENTDNLIHLTLPKRPSQISEEDLKHVSGGKGPPDPIFIW